MKLLLLLNSIISMAMLEMPYFFPESNDITIYPTNVNIVQCQNYCFDTPGCVGVTLSTSSGLCNLKYSADGKNGTLMGTSFWTRGQQILNLKIGDDSIIENAYKTTSYYCYQFCTEQVNSIFVAASVSFFNNLVSKYDRLVWML